MKRVSPKRRLAPVQCNVGYLHRQFRTLAIRDGVNCYQRRTQFLRIDLSFRPPHLETGLRFGHTILDGFDWIASRESAPRTSPVTFQDNVRVYEHGAMVPHHRSSQFDRELDAVRHEQIRQVFDG